MAVQFPRTPGSVPSTATRLGLGTHRSGIYGTLGTRPFIQTSHQTPTNNTRLRRALNLRVITPSKHQEEPVEYLGDAATYLSPLSSHKVVTSFAPGDISGRPRTRLEAQVRRKRNIWTMERSGDWGCVDYLEWHRGEICPCQAHKDYMEGDYVESDEEVEIYLGAGNDGLSSGYLEVLSDTSVAERETRVGNWVKEQSRWSWTPCTDDSQSSRHQKPHSPLCAFCGKISKASRRSASDLESGSYRDDIFMQEGPYRDDSVHGRPWSGLEDYLCSECDAEFELVSLGQWWPTKRMMWWTVGAVGAVAAVAWAGTVWRYLVSVHP